LRVCPFGLLSRPNDRSKRTRLRLRGIVGPASFPFNGFCPRELLGGIYFPIFLSRVGVLFSHRCPPFGIRRESRNFTTAPSPNWNLNTPPIPFGSCQRLAPRFFLIFSINSFAPTTLAGRQMRSSAHPSLCSILPLSIRRVLRWNGSSRKGSRPPRSLPAPTD